MAGINRFTGKPISGWPEVAQSLECILTTAIGERVERRRFGADDTVLQDRPLNEGSIVDAFIAIAEAIAPRLVNGVQYGEPRFALNRIRLAEAAGSGRAVFELQGLYFPRGHYGDFSQVQEQVFSFNPAGAPT